MQQRTLAPIREVTTIQIPAALYVEILRYIEAHPEKAYTSASDFVRDQVRRALGQ